MAKLYPFLVLQFVCSSDSFIQKWSKNDVFLAVSFQQNKEVWSQNVYISHLYIPFRITYQNKVNQISYSFLPNLFMNKWNNKIFALQVW